MKIRNKRRQHVLAAHPKRLLTSRRSVVFGIALLLAGALYAALATKAAPVLLGSIEAEQFSMPPGASVQNDTNASAGKALKLTQNSSATGTISINGVGTSVSFRARGDSCRGAPRLAVFVDGNQVASTSISSSVYASYTVSRSLSPGQHNVTAKVTNPRSRNSCTRAIYLDKVEVSGQTVAATPVPSTSISPTASPTPGVIQPTGSSPFTRLVWSDEFTGAANTPLSNKWWYDIGAGQGGWGNNELQSYTNRTSNVSLDGNGALNITAQKETYTGADGQTRSYTSGRVNSSQTFTYGHMEARIWSPAGRGLWGAFWLNNEPWPQMGEIDVFEALGEDPYQSHGTAHGPDSTGPYSWSSYGKGGTYQSPSPLTAGYHVYGVTWQPDKIEWHVDGVPYFSIKPSDLPANNKWVFSNPLRVILNLSVGGSWPVQPDSTTPFPSTLKVDWVRVFQ